MIGASSTSGADPFFGHIGMCYVFGVVWWELTHSLLFRSLLLSLSDEFIWMNTALDNAKTTLLYDLGLVSLAAPGTPISLWLTFTLGNPFVDLSGNGVNFTLVGNSVGGMYASATNSSISIPLCPVGSKTVDDGHVSIMRGSPLIVTHVSGAPSWTAYQTSFTACAWVRRDRTGVADTFMGWAQNATGVDSSAVRASAVQCLTDDAPLCLNLNLMYVVCSV